MTSAARRDPAQPEARTAAGRVRGCREGGLAVFRGIPLAQPPTGRERRFTPDAIGYADRVAARVVLIDGQTLSSLLVSPNIGYKISKPS